MDPVQLTIIIISFALALLLIVLGIQVWYILKEMRLSLQKMNKMLDDAGKVSGTKRRNRRHVRICERDKNRYERHHIAF